MSTDGIFASNELSSFRHIGVVPTPRDEVALILSCYRIYYGVFTLVSHSTTGRNSKSVLAQERNKENANIHSMPVGEVVVLARYHQSN